MDKNIRYKRILSCRYYSGETNPANDEFSLFRGYECAWVNGKHQNWDCEIEDIKRLGLLDWLYNDDGTDPDLKCLLFNRYCHWIGLNGQTKSFIHWYNECYVKPRLTNRQRRANERRPILIASCRYYKGEPTNPYKETPDEMNWFYEKCWVEQLTYSYENAKPYRLETPNMFDDIAENYNIPRSLIGLLLNRYEHWACVGGVNYDSFRNWLLHVYLKIKE